MSGTINIAFRAALLLGTAAIVFGQPSRASQPLLGVQKLTAADGFTCASVNGGAQCWGNNLSGQLGNGRKGYLAGTTSPAVVTGLESGVSAVSAGGDHACAIVSGGAVRCWGVNSSGELGNGSTSPTLYALPVSGIAGGTSAIAAFGQQYFDGATCAIVNGEVLCWGRNIEGELGNGAGTNSPLPVPVGGLGSGVSAISAGGLHACAIASGNLLCWGSNSQGELGDGSTTDRLSPVPVGSLAAPVSAVAAGYVHSCAIANGAVLCWGYGAFGALGNGTTAAVAVPAPVPVTGLGTGASAISAGQYYTCAIVKNGAGVKCWGRNNAGQLGNGSATDSATPVDVSLIGVSKVTAIAAGDSHACALVTTTANLIEMQCWGSNVYGALGLGGVLQSYQPVSVFGVSSGATAVASGPGARHTCALVNGAAMCWGENPFGQLGNGNLSDSGTPQAVSGLGSAVAQVTAGGMGYFTFDTGHACAIAGDALQCWGYGGAGELGTGGTADSAVPVPVIGSGVTAVSAGVIHTCAIVNNTAKCWGRNLSGELGDGTTTEANAPINVAGLAAGVSMLSTGGYNATRSFTCAIVNGAVSCWGAGLTGSACCGSGVPTAVPGLGAGVTKIGAGSDSVCAIMSGAAWCSGGNSTGDLGNGLAAGTTVPVTGLASGVTSIAGGYYYSCAVANGAAKCWGDNSYQALGVSYGSTFKGATSNSYSSTPVTVTGLATGVAATAAAIAASFDHTCAVLVDGSIKCWGDNHYGQLGDGRLVEALTPQIVKLGETIFQGGFEP